MTGCIKRTSARDIKKVDAGIASLAKSMDAPMIETCSVRRRGFFNGRATSPGTGAAASRGATTSVPVRLARRRSIAGPIPVVFSETGLYRTTQ